MKATVWISAVIYLGIAVTILTIVLSAGMPVIYRIRDRNTIEETKVIMHTLDDAIRDAAIKGPGNKRGPFVVEINKGDFTIDAENDLIIWNLENSRYLYSQLDTVYTEGNLQILTTNSTMQNRYNVKLMLNYSAKNIDINSNFKTLMGKYTLYITNYGSTREGRINITIEEMS